jgi:hypothetical protein
MPDRVLLSPEVSSLADLGASAPEDLFDPIRLVTGRRVERLYEGPGRRVLRLPLPGTPDAQGHMPEPPRGAGTGWLQVQLFRGGAAESARLHLTRPRSSSPAAREWNLACHLLATGVAVARPVALIERGRGLGVQHSCLVTRELEGWVPLGEWLESHSGADRKLGLTSVGACLARVFHARAWFPRLALDDLLVEDRPLTESVEARDDDCAALTLERMRARQALRADLAATGLRLARLPSAALGRLSGGRLVARIAPRRRLQLLERLCNEAHQRASLTDSERRRVWVQLRA